MPVARVLARLSLAALLPLGGAATCASDDPAGSDGGDASLPTRTFRMGFSALPPRLDTPSALATIDAWSPRADAAIMHVSVPYKALLSGITAAAYVQAQDQPLADLYRRKGLEIVVTLDVTDGLNRAAEAPELVALGRSIREPAVQQVYREYVRAIVERVRPRWLGLAAETNLIRTAARAPVYAALVQMTNAAAADVRALPSPPTLYASVQAEVAWGGLQGTHRYEGVEKDFTDFPFAQALGVSSYPYFAFKTPEEIPLDYFARLPNGRTLPLLVVEGGWTSASVGTVTSSAAAQARWIRRQEALLDSARAVAWFQLTYTDLDLAAWPPQPAGSILPLFAQLGFVSPTFVPKPALAVWDSVKARRLKE